MILATIQTKRILLAGEPDVFLIEVKQGLLSCFLGKKIPIFEKEMKRYLKEFKENKTDLVE